MNRGVIHVVPNLLAGGDNASFIHYTSNSVRLLRQLVVSSGTIKVGGATSRNIMFAKAARSLFSKPVIESCLLPVRESGGQLVRRTEKSKKPAWGNSRSGLYSVACLPGTYIRHSVLYPAKRWVQYNGVVWRLSKPI